MNSQVLSQIFNTLNVMRVDTKGILAAITAAITSNTSQVGITAHAGGGQASATQLTALYSRVDTVTTANDSVKAIWAVVNARMVIQNNGANDMNVYPMLGDNFLGLAANAPYTVASGNQLAIYCYSIGAWTPQ